MCQYIDVTQIVRALPTTSILLNRSNITVEFELRSAYEEIMESGAIRKIKTSTVVYNIPDTHYVEFRGVKTNIGLSTEDGVLKNDIFGYVYVHVENLSLQRHTLPVLMNVGSLSIKQYKDFSGCDTVDEIYTHGGHKHFCSPSCSHYENIV